MALFFVECVSNGKISWKVLPLFCAVLVKGKLNYLKIGKNGKFDREVRTLKKNVSSVTEQPYEKAEAASMPLFMISNAPMIPCFQ